MPPPLPRQRPPAKADASNFLSLRPFTHDVGALITLPVSGVCESTRQGMQGRIKITITITIKPAARLRRVRGEGGQHVCLAQGFTSRTGPSAPPTLRSKHALNADVGSRHRNRDRDRYRDRTSFDPNRERSRAKRLKMDDPDPDGDLDESKLRPVEGPYTVTGRR
jgi:hypothetical protein